LAGSRADLDVVVKGKIPALLGIEHWSFSPQKVSIKAGNFLAS
jgi:hypothetical protein